MLVTSIASFSHNVFSSFLYHLTCYKTKKKFKHINLILSNALNNYDVSDIISITCVLSQQVDAIQVFLESLSLEANEDHEEEGEHHEEEGEHHEEEGEHHEEEGEEHHVELITEMVCTSCSNH